MTKQQYFKPCITKIVTGMPGKHGVSLNHEYTAKIDGVDVNWLIDKYDSPLFVFSEQTIRDTVTNAQQAFQTCYPKVQFAWSYKTNYNEAICRIFHKLGCWAEVVSEFEYNKALASGVKPNQIIFNGPHKSDEILKFASENKSLIHIDHFSEIEQLTRIANQTNTVPNVAIRINLDVGVYPLWDRFGFNYENGQAFAAIEKIIKSAKLNLMGIHAHIGTYMNDSAFYQTAMEKLVDLYLHTQHSFEHTLDYIDIGGGFASKNTLRGAYLPAEDTTPSFDDYARAISQVIYDSNIPQDNLPTLIIESGRAMIDDSGYLVGSVVANKTLASGQRAMVVDVGVNLLFTSFWYEHKITPVNSGNYFNHENTVIYGPLCMNIDVVRSQACLPALEPGEHFVVHRVGAYNLTQWLQFIHMRPKVVLIDCNSKVHVIRNNETLEYVCQPEVVPDYLK